MVGAGVIRSKIRGLPELAAALKSLPAEVASKNGGPLARALKQSADVVAEEARRLVPVDTGRLRDNIVVRRNPRPEGTEGYTVTARAGRGPKDPNGAYYAGAVEFGTSRTKAQPFMRPAVENTKGEAVQVLAEELGKGIERAAKRARRLGL